MAIAEGPPPSHKEHCLYFVESSGIQDTLCAKLLLSIWTTSFDYKTVGEPVFIISLEVFCTTLKLFQPPAEQVVFLFSKVPFFGSSKNSSMENRAMP